MTFTHAVLSAWYLLATVLIVARFVKVVWPFDRGEWIVCVLLVVAWPAVMVAEAVCWFGERR